MEIIVLLKRITQWKNHLIPPLIALVYIFFPFNSADQAVYIQLISYLLALFFVSLFGYWMNDSFDIELDRKAGKSNFLAKTSTSFRIVGGVLIVLTAFIFWHFTKPPLVATLLFCTEVIFFSLYCIPGIRFKNHPFIGPLFDAHYTHILPVFFTWFLFADQSFSFWLIPLYFLLLFKGFRNILLHQLHDRKGDARMQMRTFPRVLGPYFTVKIINRIFIPLEMIFISVLSFILIPISLYPMIFWLGFLTVYFFFFSGWQFHFMNARYFVFKFHYFLNDYYEFWLPFMAIWSSLLSFQIKIILSAIHLVIFYKTIFYLQKLFFKILSNLRILKAS